MPHQSNTYQCFQEDINQYHLQIKIIFTNLLCYAYQQNCQTIYKTIITNQELKQCKNIKNTQILYQNLKNSRKIIKIINNINNSNLTINITNYQFEFPLILSPGMIDRSNSIPNSKQQLEQSYNRYLEDIRNNIIEIKKKSMTINMLTKKINQQQKRLIKLKQQSYIQSRQDLILKIQHKSNDLRQKKNTLFLLENIFQKNNDVLMKLTSSTSKLYQDDRVQEDKTFKDHQQQSIMLSGSEQQDAKANTVISIPIVNGSILKSLQSEKSKKQSKLKSANKKAE